LREKGEGAEKDRVPIRRGQLAARAESGRRRSISIMGKAKKTRKFAEVKRMISPKDARVYAVNL
jgi:hypothetical protein